MRIGSNPFPPKSTVIQTDHQKISARRIERNDSLTENRDEKPRFRNRTETVERAEPADQRSAASKRSKSAEYVSRAQAYEQNLNTLPPKSKNAIRSYQDHADTRLLDSGSGQLAGVDLYV